MARKKQSDESIEALAPPVGPEPWEDLAVDEFCRVRDCVAMILKITRAAAVQMIRAMGPDELAELRANVRDLNRKADLA